MRDRQEMMEALFKAVKSTLNEKDPDKPRFGFFLLLSEVGREQRYEYISNIEEDDLLNLMMEIALTGKMNSDQEKSE